MSNPEKEGLQKWIDKLANAVIDDLSQSDRTDSRSSVYLDSQTINLLLIYILMNKDMEFSQKNRSFTGNMDEIAEEIDALIEENEKHFTELIKEAQKGL